MATKSLAAQTPGALSTPLKMPSIFQAPAEPVKARVIAPYITFAHPKRADEWAKLTNAFGQIAEGEMYLIRSNSLHKLDPAKLSLFCCKQYWGKTNAAGELLGVSWVEMPFPYKEHIEAVVLVYLESEVLPANVCFRSTKCPAGKSLSDALAEAAKPAWGDRSAAHAESLVCALPMMRFFGEVRLGPQRIGKSSGLPYRPTVCSIKPTAAPEWRLLKAFQENADVQKSLDDAANRYMSRLAELEAKVGK
jgi:hypothetical protein